MQGQTPHNKELFSQNISSAEFKNLALEVLNKKYRNRLATTKQIKGEINQVLYLENNNNKNKRKKLAN